MEQANQQGDIDDNMDLEPTGRFLFTRRRRAVYIGEHIQKQATTPFNHMHDLP
jgi:hypothetical protein